MRRAPARRLAACAVRSGSARASIVAGWASIISCRAVGIGRTSGVAGGEWGRGRGQPGGDDDWFAGAGADQPWLAGIKARRCDPTGAVHELDEAHRSLARDDERLEAAAGGEARDAAFGLGQGHAVQARRVDVQTSLLSGRVAFPHGVLDVMAEHLDRKPSPRSGQVEVALQPGVVIVGAPDRPEGDAEAAVDTQGTPRREGLEGPREPSRDAVCHAVSWWRWRRSAAKRAGG